MRNWAARAWVGASEWAGFFAALRGWVMAGVLGFVLGACDEFRECAERAIDPVELPEHLSETGLYSDLGGGVLAHGVRAYSPSFALWSDGADKRRFVLLPDGASGPRCYDPKHSFDFVLRVDQLQSVEATATVRTAVDQVIERGHSAASEVVQRMKVRDRDLPSMPPLATEQVDQIGLQSVRAFIDSL